MNTIAINEEDKILKESRKIFEEMVENGNWVFLTDVLMAWLIRGVFRPIGVLANNVEEDDRNNKKIIATVRDMLFEQKFLVVKYDGESFDVLEAHG